MKLSALLAGCLLLASSASAQWSKDPALNTRLSDGAGDEVQAKIRGGADGHAYVSWFDSDPSGSPAFGYDVKLQRLDPAGNELWAAGGVTIADRGFSSTQDYGMDAGPNGDAFLVFRDDRFGGTEITVTRVDADGNQVWGPTGIQLTSGAGFVASPRIAATSDGACVVAWVEGNTSRIQRVAAN